MMRFKIVYNPEVFNDIQQAVDWYNRQQPKLGIRFFSVLKKHLNSLENSAMHFAVRYDDVRCMPIKKFPYMIHYRIHNESVMVEAILSTHRNPEFWGERTKKTKK